LLSLSKHALRPFLHRVGRRAVIARFFVYVKNADETFKIAVEAGAKILSEPSDQPYGRSGGVTDPFGNSWWFVSVKK
jgi:uncharacterized glyoxalase superfamily protein PhnB